MMMLLRKIWKAYDTAWEFLIVGVITGAIAINTYGSKWLSYLVMPLVVLGMYLFDFSSRHLLIACGVWIAVLFCRNIALHHEMRYRICLLEGEFYHLRRRLFSEEVAAEDRAKRRFQNYYGDPPEVSPKPHRTSVHE